MAEESSKPIRRKLAPFSGDRIYGPLTAMAALSLEEARALTPDEMSAIEMGLLVKPSEPGAREKPYEVIPRPTNGPLTAVAALSPEEGHALTPEAIRELEDHLLSALPPAERPALHRALDQEVAALAALTPEERRALEADLLSDHRLGEGSSTLQRALAHELAAWGALTPEERRARLAASRSPLAMARALRREVEESGQDISQLNDLAALNISDPSKKIEELQFKPVKIAEAGEKIALIETRHRLFLECADKFTDKNTGITGRNGVYKASLARKETYKAFAARRKEYNSTVPTDKRVYEPANNDERRMESDTLFRMRESIDRGDKAYPLERWVIRRILAMSHGETLWDIADDLRLSPDRHREHSEFVARWNQSIAEWNESNPEDPRKPRSDPLDDFNELDP